MHMHTALRRLGTLAMAAGVGLAVMNRLLRAAAFRVVD